MKYAKIKSLRTVKNIYIVHPVFCSLLAGGDFAAVHSRSLGPKAAEEPRRQGQDDFLQTRRPQFALAALEVRVSTHSFFFILSTICVIFCLSVYPVKSCEKAKWRLTTKGLFKTTKTALKTSIATLWTECPGPICRPTISTPASTEKHTKFATQVHLINKSFK